MIQRIWMHGLGAPQLGKEGGSQAHPEGTKCYLSLGAWSDIMVDEPSAV
jgi:hypothetical protein